MTAEPDSVIRSYLQGDEAALRRLLEDHTPGLLIRIEQKMAPLLRRRVSVHDVMQEVSMMAFEKRGEFTGSTPEDFRRWIGGIADHRVYAQVNRYLGTKKRSLYQEVSRSSRDAAVHPVSPTPSPSQNAMGTELEEIAAKALEMLPDVYREVLRLRRESGSSLREVAESMGRTLDATKKLHGRAMIEFADHFKRLRGHADA